jgi:hypothetical protein
MGKITGWPDNGRKGSKSRINIVFPGLPADVGKDVLFSGGRPCRVVCFHSLGAQNEKAKEEKIVWDEANLAQELFTPANFLLQIREKSGLLLDVPEHVVDFLLRELRWRVGESDPVCGNLCCNVVGFDLAAKARDIKNTNPYKPIPASCNANNC